MICDVCGKIQASVHLTEIVNNQMTELHLCEQCAREKSMHVEQQFGLADLLAGLAQLESKSAVDKDAAAMKCPDCQITYDDFRKTGRLGCGGCYTAFRKLLSPLLRKIHGSVNHIGKKVPGKTHKVSRAQKTDERKPDYSELKSAPENPVSDLRVKLQQAISKEDFEEAARLRDKIRDLEGGNK